MDFTQFTDEQFLAHIYIRGNLTPVEAEFASRLTRALDEIDQLTLCPALDSVPAEQG